MSDKLDARRCRKCNHAARYYSPAHGFCALVLPENVGGEGVTRYYCGCRCEWGAAVKAEDVSGYLHQRSLERDAADQRQRAERAEAELARLREAVRGLCAMLHADSPHDPSGEVEP